MKVFSRFKLPSGGVVKCGVHAALNPVQRQFKSICDINNIVRRAFAGDATVFRAARCGDLSGAPDDLHSALQSQVDARNAYNDLPVSVRKEYPTPAAFYAACHDDKQLEKLRSLGIANPEEIEMPVKVEITNPSTNVTAPAAE